MHADQDVEKPLCREEIRARRRERRKIKKTRSPAKEQSLRVLKNTPIVMVGELSGKELMAAVRAAREQTQQVNT